MRRSTLIWLFLALALGGATGWAVHVYGVGPLRAQATWLALIAAVATYLARHIRLRPPTDRHSRSRASLTGRGKAWLLGVFAAATLAALGYAVWQGAQGYTELKPPMLLTDADPPRSGFFIAEGRPQLEALYRLGGRDGDRYIAPLDTFEGRLLIIVDAQPPTTAVRVSGRLRSDIRAVQTPDTPSDDQRTEVLAPADPSVSGPAPFLPQYRQHLRLPPNAPVWFLDTGVRAGLNLTTVLLVLVPGFLFLLTMGAPTRPPPRPLRRRPDPRPGRG